MAWKRRGARGRMDELAHTLVPYLEMEFLDFLSFTAITTTLGLFLCGIPICRSIARKGTTEGISAAPFLLGTIGCVFWLRYGFLRVDNSVVTINGIGFFLQVAYLLFYYSYSRSRATLHRRILVLLAMTAAMLLYVRRLEEEGRAASAVDHLGLMCLTLNILNLGAPLAGLQDVVRTRSTENLPFPMCLANLLVSAQWFLYGILVADPYIKIPNCVGILLAVIQLSLFVIYPSRRVHAT